jgi:hypothetical protein
MTALTPFMDPNIAENGQKASLSLAQWVMMAKGAFRALKDLKVIVVYRVSRVIKA